MDAVVQALQRDLIDADGSERLLLWLMDLAASPPAGLGPST